MAIHWFPDADNCIEIQGWLWMMMQAQGIWPNYRRFHLHPIERINSKWKLASLTDLAISIWAVDTPVHWVEYLWSVFGKIHLKLPIIRLGVSSAAGLAPCSGDLFSSGISFCWICFSTFPFLLPSLTSEPDQNHPEGGVILNSMRDFM